MELLLLFFGVCQYAFPLHQYLYQGYDLTGSYCTYLTNSDDSGFGCYLDKSLISDDSVDTSCLYITTPYVDLPKGSYKVSIAYAADDVNGTYSVTSEFRTYPVITGHESVKLFPQNKREEFSFFSPIGVDEYQVHINYGGEGSIFVESVTISETNAWKNILLFCIVLFLLLLDGVIWWYRRVPEAHRRNARLTLALLFGLTIYTSVPVFSFFLPGGDDLSFHLNRIEAIRYSLQAGQFPNRVSAFWNNGYGYAAGVLYGELFLYVPAFLRILGFSVQNAYKFYVVGVNFATACIACYCFKRIFHRDTAVWIGCALYMLAPYRLVSVFLRGAVGEYTAMAFFPLIFYGLYRIYMEDPEKEDYKRSFLPLLLGCSGLLQCHVISCMMAGVFGGLFCLVFIRKTFQPKRLFQLCMAGAGTVLLNLWFLLPFADYFLKGYAVSSDTMNVLGRFNANGAFASQMFSFFQEAAKASYSVAESLTAKERNYALGVFSLAAFCYLGCRLYRGKEKSLIVRIGDFSMLSAALSLWMCTIWFPWDFIQQMNGLFRLITRNIQLPWRFLGVSSFFLTVTAICLAMLLQDMPNRSVCYGLLAVICAVALISADYFLYDFTRCAPSERYVDAQDLDSCYGGDAEYLPEGTPPDFCADTAPVPGSLLEITQHRFEKGAHMVTCSSLSDEESHIDMPLLPYAGYICRDVQTGRELDISLDVPGKVRVIVPASYSGSFRLVFREPRHWRAAEAFSVLCLLFGGIWFWNIQRRKSDSMRRRSSHE